MFGNKVRLSIKKSDTEWYSISGRYVSTSTDPYYLKYSPHEWDEMEIGIGRSDIHSGLMLKFLPNSFRFVKDGANILRHIFYLYGSEAEAWLVLEVLDSTTLTYKVEETAKMDFASFVDERLSVDISIKQEGVAQKVMANEDIEYEIPITGSDVANVTVQPLLVEGSAKLMTGWPIPGEDGGSFELSGTIPIYKIYVPYVNKTLVPVSDQAGNEPISFANPNNNGGISGQNFEQFNIAGGVFSNANNFLLKANVALTNIVFKTTINFFIENLSGSTGTYSCELSKRTAAGTLVSVEAKSLGSIGGSAQVNGSFTFNTTPFTMAAGDSLILTFGFSNGGSINSHKFAIEKENNIDITFQHYTSSFNVQGLRWYKVAELLVKAMTDGKGSFSSPFLSNPSAPYAGGYDNRPYDTILFPGDAIRGVNTSPYTTPVLKIKFSDLFKDGTSRWDIGMNISGNTVYMKARADYFNKSKQICHISTVADCKTSLADDYQYNKIKIGYPSQEYDDLNGRDEFNTTHVYKLPLDTTDKELDFTSPFRADMYGIFFTWVRRSTRKTSDSKSDNDIFVLEITSSGGGYVPLRLSGTASGVTNSNNALNYGLSPKRNFYRCRKFIYSLLFRCEGKTITFQTTDKNAGLQSTFSSRLVDEDADVPVNDLAVSPRHFIPLMFEVEAAVPKDLMTLIEANPDGYISFDWNGKVHKGYPWEVAKKLAKPTSQKLLLMATADHDLSFTPTELTATPYYPNSGGVFGDMFGDEFD